MEYSTCPERATGVRKLMGSIPAGDSDFFFFPRSRHVEYSMFSYFFSELKNSPSFFIYQQLVYSSEASMSDSQLGCLAPEQYLDNKEKK